MNTHSQEPEAVLRDLPEGMLDHLARVAIHDLVRLYGFDHARMLVAMYLNDEAARRPQ